MTSQAAMKHRYVIFACGFDENKGGTIALHRLCDLINSLGGEAYLWPCTKPLLERHRPIRSLLRLIKYYLFHGTKKYRTNEHFDTPIADKSKLQHAIVVYPEVIRGNPLNADKVVRWFMHKPGFLRSGVTYGQNDLYFYFNDSFNDRRLNLHPGHKLHVTYVMDHIYRQFNFGERSGTCYMLRKGKDRRIVHDLEDSVLVDGLSHEEMAKVFNSVKTYISYDTYTYYSVYAAMCGCLSIVVPEEGVSKKDWFGSDGPYGVAYGFDDVDWAVQTQHLALKQQKETERKANAQVADFLRTCEAHFS